MVRAKMVMIPVRLHKTRIDEILLIVKDLRDQGLKQGADFDFAYNQSRWDDMTGEIPGYVEFRFYDSRWATWFNLKWS